LTVTADQLRKRLQAEEAKTVAAKNTVLELEKQAADLQAEIQNADASQVVEVDDDLRQLEVR